jgi:hypothetical protein
MSRIYVGEKLVWEKDTLCEYGDLSDYEITSFISYFYSENCRDVDISLSLDSARIALDLRRDPLCSSYFSGGIAAATDTIIVGGYVLEGNSLNGNIYCDLELSIGGWRIIPRYGYSTIGTVPIIQVTNGVITYVEYY